MQTAPVPENCWWQCRERMVSRRCPRNYRLMSPASYSSKAGTVLYVKGKYLSTWIIVSVLPNITSAKGDPVSLSSWSLCRKSGDTGFSKSLSQDTLPKAFDSPMKSCRATSAATDCGKVFFIDCKWNEQMIPNKYSLWPSCIPPVCLSTEHFLLNTSEGLSTPFLQILVLKMFSVMFSCTIAQSK